MIIFNLIDLRKLRRVILYFVCILITLTLQGSIFSRIEIFGVKAMFVPVIVVSIGLFEGGLWGGLLGLVCGVLCDFASSDTLVLFTVVMTVIGFCSGLMAELLVNRRFYSYMIVALLSLALLALCQIVPLWIYRGVSLGPLLRTGALQVLWSLPFAVPAYFACKAIHAHTRKT